MQTPKDDEDKFNETLRRMLNTPPKPRKPKPKPRKDKPLSSNEK